MAPSIARVVALTAGLASTEARAQVSCPVDSRDIPAANDSTPRAPTFQDFGRIASLYREYDKALAEIIATQGWMGLAGDSVAQFNVTTTRSEIHQLLKAVRQRRATGDVGSAVKLRIRELFDAVNREMYGDSIPTPPELNCPENAIAAILGTRLNASLDEYFRRFFIKYGGSSERLNWLEMALSEAMFTPEAKSRRVEMPSPFEWILRAQALGYQYDDSAKAFRPSSPIYQAGLSYYFFGTSRASRWINHMGLAAAYEYDLNTSRHLRGVVLHVWRVDLGLLCSANWPSCAKPVWASSVNLQLIPGLF